MVLIPHGSFQIGTTDEELEREKVPEMFRDYEKPRHTVTIGADFYLGKYDVTVGEFKAFVRATGPRPAGGCENWEKGSDGQYGWQFKQDRTWDRPGFPQTDRDPVVCVSYDDAVAYIGWLNASAGTKAYRLPGEAEWEYAARANTTTARFWGDGRDAACRFANVADLSLAKHDGIATPNQERYFNCTDGFVFTAPAGSFLSNDFGLYDMLGNVWQWTADCWNDDLTNIPPNGTTRSTGGCGLRVVRGGSWNSGPRVVRAGCRSGNGTGVRGTDTGFRVARTL
jgi:formylglycine-generating enzyme required for sulfatase activity